MNFHIQLSNCLGEQWQLPSIDPRALALEVMLQCIRDRSEGVHYSISDRVVGEPLQGPMVTITDLNSGNVLEQDISCSSLMDAVEFLDKHDLLQVIDDQPEISPLNRVRIKSMLSLLDEHAHNAVMFEWFYYPINQRHITTVLGKLLPMSKRVFYLYNSKLSDTVMETIVKPHQLDDDFVFQQSKQQEYKARLLYSTQSLNNNTDSTSDLNEKDKLTEILSTNYTMKVFRQFRRAYHAFEKLLEESQTDYLFGTREPTSLDCALYAYLALHTQAGYECIPLKTILIFEFPRLLEFVERFRRRHFDSRPSYIDSVWGCRRSLPQEPFITYSAIRTNVGLFLEGLKDAVFSDEEPEKQEDTFDTQESKELQQFRFQRNIWIAGSTLAVSIYIYNRIIRPLLENM